MSTYRCSASQPCKAGLCCGVDGICASTGNACDILRGCTANCAAVPSPIQCGFRTTLPSDLFTSKLYTNTSRTGTTPALVARAPVEITSVSGAICSQPSALQPQDYPLQPCDLVDIMGGPTQCPYCLFYYDYVREAMEAYDMLPLGVTNCSPTAVRQGSHRAAAFLAQIRHETASLLSLYQPIDRGAGAIHMIPLHFESAARAIPRLWQAIQTELPGLDWEAVRTDTALQERVGLIIQRPEHAFLTAGWWFTQGAMIQLDPTCGDLRTVADAGTGIGTNNSAATGFYKTSRCIFGTLTDTGSVQRLHYYAVARSYTDQFSSSYVRVPPNTANPSPSPTLPPGSTTFRPISTSAIIGCAITSLVVIVFVVHLIRKRRGGPTFGVPIAVQNLVDTRGGPVPKYEHMASHVELKAHDQEKPQGSKDKMVHVREPAKVEIEKSAAVSPMSPTDETPSLTKGQ